MQGLSLVAASGGHSSSLCAGLSLSRPLLLWSTGSRRSGSAVLAHGPSCSVACGILPDQGSNPCPLHWQADSQPLSHQGSPVFSFLFFKGVECGYAPFAKTRHSIFFISQYSVSAGSNCDSYFESLFLKLEEAKGSKIRFVPVVAE